MAKMPVEERPDFMLRTMLRMLPNLPGGPLPPLVIAYKLCEVLSTIYSQISATDSARLLEAGMLLLKLEFGDGKEISPEDILERSKQHTLTNFGGSAH